MDRDVNVDAKHEASTEVFFSKPSRYCRAHTVNAISASGAFVVCVFLLLSVLPSTDDTRKLSVPGWAHILMIHTAVSGLNEDFCNESSISTLLTSSVLLLFRDSEQQKLCTVCLTFAIVKNSQHHFPIWMLSTNSMLYYFQLFLFESEFCLQVGGSSTSVTIRRFTFLMPMYLSIVLSKRYRSSKTSSLSLASVKELEGWKRLWD